MSIKKYSSGSWVTVPFRKYETATDTITTLPKQIIADGQSASAVIKGNLSQSGTPTPASPIYPTECGDLVESGEHSGQYEIPISSDGTTTPVYLGDVQSTRRIKKLVLDGTENWASHWSSNSLFTLDTITDYIHDRIDNAICSHYLTITTVNGYINVNNMELAFYYNPSSPTSSVMYIRDDSISNATALKTYLQQQYAAGTPVTVWYVLATETTGVVNEPIRKIGTYSDSVSVTGIPTTGTAESFDIDTTLKPSEVDLTYHGWHEHSDTKFT